MRLPAGVRDWLPAELRYKREIEEGLRRVFSGLGYAEVETPNIELIETLAFGLGERMARKVFQFEDRRGTALALRPEMTTSIARLVSTRMRNAPLPLRLSYVAHAFRYEEPQEGRMREFTQAGIEYIGPATPEADAEAVLSTLRALEAIGIAGVRIDINHVAIVDGVLAQFGFRDEAADEIKFMLARRDIVALQDRLASGDAAVAAELTSLALARGGHDLLIRLHALCAEPAARAGIDRLRYVLDCLREAGYEQAVCVDFSLVRELGYYTGLVFEGYISELGFPLCGGGRYDSLLPRFGFEAGAIGWATGIERLIIAKERRRIPLSSAQGGKVYS